MKRLMCLLVTFFAIQCYSQNADAIVGRWIRIPKADMVIQVYKAGNEYKGKIASVKSTGNKKLVGFVILENLKYDADKKMWEDGKVHSPSGNTYNAEAKIKSNGSLEVLGYAGMRLFGSKKYFKRVT